MLEKMKFIQNNNNKLKYIVTTDAASSNKKAVTLINETVDVIAHVLCFNHTIHNSISELNNIPSY